NVRSKGDSIVDGLKFRPSSNLQAGFSGGAQISSQYLSKPLFRYAGRRSVFLAIAAAGTSSVNASTGPAWMHCQGPGSGSDQNCNWRTWPDSGPGMLRGSTELIPECTLPGGSSRNCARGRPASRLSTPRRLVPG